MSNNKGYLPQNIFNIAEIRVVIFFTSDYLYIGIIQWSLLENSRFGIFNYGIE